MSENGDLEAPRSDVEVLPAEPIVPPPEPSEEEPHPFVGPDGELRGVELAFRIGLLLGAGLFLIEGQGSPFSRAPLVIVGAFAMSALIVLTMAMQWRVLGDWRRATQQIVLAGLILVLAIPLGAILTPKVGGAALPEWLALPLTQVLSTLQKIPGLDVALALLKGVLVFMLYVVVMIALVATSSPGRWGGFLVIAGGVAAFSLFFYPTPESAVGLALLAFFLRVQWERPVLVPDRLRGHLSRRQMDFLAELTGAGALSPGETKLYLEHDAQAFAELLDFGLVDYDRVLREVTPGRRLMHDPAKETLEKGLSAVRQGLWFLVGLGYVLMPDIIPGPLDDIVVMLLCSGGGLNLLSSLFGSRGRRVG
ncbi:hypothetical protein KQI84_10120 [bacterium]|nr:hypothetical protein [bacterium]